VAARSRITAAAASSLRVSLRIDAFAPQPLNTETLFVRRRDAHLGSTMCAFAVLPADLATAA
jgi:hypothetical protein